MEWVSSGTLRRKELLCVELDKLLTAGFDTSKGRYSRPGDAYPVRWNLHVTVDSEICHIYHPARDFDRARSVPRHRHL